MAKFSRELDVLARAYSSYVLGIPAIAIGVGALLERDLAVAAVSALVLVTSLGPQRRWWSGDRYQAPVRSFRLSRSAPGFRRRRARVEADDAGLVMNGKRVVARSDIASAYYHAPTRTVRLLTKRAFGSRVELEVEDEAVAKELLAALRVDVTQAVATYETSHPLRGRVLGPLQWLLLFAVFAAHGGLGLPFVVSFVVGALIVPLLVDTVRYRKIAVGSDGIAVASHLRQRFFAFADIDGVEVENTNLVLVLRSGARVKVRGGSELDAIAGRTRAALVAFRSRTAATPAEPASRLAPRAGTTRDWIRMLRSATEAPGYRAGAIPAETLWRIAEDPSAAPLTRAGAAVALRGDLDEEGRARLRVAAEASAAPRLRFALEAVANAEADANDEEQLTRALDSLRAEV